jgi:hypothetical protein
MDFSSPGEDRRSDRLELRDDGSVGPKDAPAKNNGDGSSERLVEEEVTNPNC